MTSSIKPVTPIVPINPGTYQQHFIHTQERDWAETNCYVDVWIEQLHALGFEPVAAMSFTLGIDFEGDQWTFFKFSLDDLYQLYGIDVQELAIWKPLVNHIEEQINLGRPVLVELDSMYLPDTVGTAYKIAHVKTTASVNFIDVKSRKMGYFHAQSYHELSGEDFDAVFRLNGNFDQSYLEPYVEIAKLNRKDKLSNAQLLQTSLSILKKQIEKMPAANPFDLFKEKLITDLEWLKTEELEMFHQYSFATLRQLGACFELASQYFDWLKSNGESGLESAINHYKSISGSAKVYQFQLARTVARGKPINLTAIDEMSQHWVEAKKFLIEKYRC